jgi:hypothetical protein
MQVFASIGSYWGSLMERLRRLWYGGEQKPAPVTLKPEDDSESEARQLASNPTGGQMEAGKNQTRVGGVILWNRGARRGLPSTPDPIPDRAHP